MAVKFTMLDTALVLARHELDALSEGDVERAAGHLETRTPLLEKILLEHDEDSETMYMMKLQALQALNIQITEVGAALKDKIRSDLKGVNKSVQAAGKYLQAAKL